MTESLSLLQHATKADIQTDPFPHVVIEDALPAELYDRLAASFPPLWLLKVDRSQNNLRWNYEAYRVRKNLLISRVWKKFIAYHTSQAFFREFANLFGEHILKAYPSRFASTEALAGMSVGTRNADTFQAKQVLLDAILAGNTAVTTPNSVRTTHIDQGPKLLTGLFYMRRDDDDSVGGDLTISRFKPSYSTEERLRCFDWAYVDDQHVETMKTIKYRKNCLVLFFNTLEALHGVTVRHETDKPRLFVNLVGEVDPPLYRLSRTGELPYYVDAPRVGEPLRQAS